MKNILTVMRRDLGALYTSPVGYIFMIVFLLISVGLYITSFFTFPVADMRSYFSNLPILLCVFIPAVTMRVWAEERKENTWEMLLTFPMKARELVLGKFLATLVFFALTLIATCTVPAMLYALGKPDGGAVLGGYLGTLLIGAFFLSIGIFFSGFCKDQIVAFVVTLLSCFVIFLLGTNFIAAYIDSMSQSLFTNFKLGSLLSQLVGVVDHYNAFTRGVIELGDIFYFVAWTVLFLLLNMMFIEGRNRPGSRMAFSTAVALCVGIGLVFNWLLTGQSLGRFDMTQGKIYTVSQASKDILKRLDVPVKVKLYITPKAKMPTEMMQLEQDITDKIEEMRIASSDKIDFSTVYLEAANVLAAPEDDKKGDKDKKDEGEETEAKSIEKRMLDKGVEPFAVQAIGDDQFTNKLIYSSIGIAYGEKKEEILPQVRPELLPELEYRLVSTVFKLTREKPPVVALFAPKEAVNIPPQMRRLYEQMGQPMPTSEDPYSTLEEVLRYEKYEVRRVALTEESPMPEEYDTLAVVNPRELNDRQRYEISRALASGKSVIMAVQNYMWDYQSSRKGISVNKREENPQINDLLSNYGLGVDTDVLMDVNHVPLRVQTNSLAAILGGGQTINLPFHISVNNAQMSQETSITSRLEKIFYLWGTAVTLDADQLKKYGLEAKTLMSTSPNAWKISSKEPLKEEFFQPPASGGKDYPLMALVSGQFPDVYKDKPRPAWPAEQPNPQMPPKPPKQEGEAKAITPAPGKLILLGCSQVYRNNFLQQGNLDLFLNSVDVLSLGDDLAKVRGKKPLDRTISAPKDGPRRLWKTINYALSSLVIAGIGITTATLRRRSRNAYTMMYAANRNAL